jgi:ABC-type transport system involved in multi-copper enzyme maturation permease subunit
MTSVWRSLLWKEWRESRWKLAIIVAACLLVPAPLAWQGGEEYIGGLAAMVVVFGPLAAMGIGADVAAGEHSRRTIHFLQALPVPMARPAAAKLFWGAVVMIVPSVVAGAMLFVFHESRGGDAASPRGWQALLLVGVTTLTALSFLLWTAAVGVNASDEVRAGAIALIVIAAIWCALVFVGHLSSNTIDGAWPRALRVVASAAPGTPAGAYAVADGTDSSRREYGWPDQFFAKSWPFAAVMVLSHGALAVWFLRRFGRIARPQAAVDAIPAAEAARGWLAPPRRSPLTAIVWKQLRESTSLALTGLAAIIGLVAITAVVIKRLEAGEFVGSVVEATIGCWATLGFAVAVVSGIGVFLDDLRPGLHTFWRSRPINVDQWFAVKLLTGLLATVVPLAVAPLAILLALHVVYGLPAPNEGLTVILSVPAIHACGYLAAVAATALLRSAGAAALATILAGVVVVALAGNYFAGDPVGAILLGAVIALTAVIVAWMAVRNDWGWKG